MSLSDRERAEGFRFSGSVTVTATATERTETPVASEEGEGIRMGYVGDGACDTRSLQGPYARVTSPGIKMPANRGESVTAGQQPLDLCYVITLYILISRIGDRTRRGGRAHGGVNGCVMERTDRVATRS